MTIKTMHYGKYVESDTPITGVLLTSNPEFLPDDINGFSLEFEEHLQTCNNEYHDECFNYDEETFLIGFKKTENKNENDPMFEIDPDTEYSAIVAPMYTQVLKSNYVSKVALCSPCYPGQGDLDTEGKFLAFTLPPDVWGSLSHLEILDLEEDLP